MTSFAYSIPSNTDIEKREYTTIANRIYPDLNIFQKVLGLLNSRVGYLWSDRLGLRSATSSLVFIKIIRLIQTQE